MTRAHLLAVAILATTVASALAQKRDEFQVVVRHVATIEGRPLLVRVYASWKADCTNRGEPSVSVDVAPQHGAVSVRPGVSTIQEYVGSGENCVGQKVPGVAVWYQPTPGYRGPDQFDITINGRSVLHDRIMVDVR